MRNFSKDRGLYRSRQGAILGVCRGIAEYLDISVFWTRVVAVALLLFTGFWPVLGLYLLAALLMKPEPMMAFSSEGSREFYDSYVNSRGLALSRLKRTFDSLSRRLQRIEDAVTAREFDWERRFNR
jgi:phage shock protein C